MKDVIAIAIVLGFFALAAGYVGWCERIIASDAPEPLRQEPNGLEGSPDRSASESDDTTAALSGRQS